MFAHGRGKLYKYSHPTHPAVHQKHGLKPHYSLHRPVQTNHELNLELMAVKQNMEASAAAARRAIDQEASRAAAAESARAEISRHFGNVMEDVKVSFVSFVALF